MANVGISAFALSTGRRVLPLGALASLRGVDPDKYTLGLGCEEMSLCGAGQDAASLGVEAAREALAAWGGDVAQIGALIVGTETAADMSRPLSAWIAEGLGLRGDFRSYEVKHACYGGTAAVRQAVEWLASGAARGKVALVVATDVALYAPNDPGEPTQGAGAAAMILSTDPVIAEIELHSYPYSLPVFDFWRPVGEAFPRVDGKFSLDCYKEAARGCFAAWQAQEGEGALAALDALCFHVPFPKMVQKAFAHVAEASRLEGAGAFYDQKVSPHMAWNRRTGNSYTASAWFSLGRALSTCAAGARIGLFSYGSGAGAELLLLRARAPLGEGWGAAMEARLGAREVVTAAQYDALRGA
jgi:hydroxymethylglutaryl-CoA synthase